jgi:DNA oxidative demethylase
MLTAPGHYYQRHYLQARDRAEILDWLGTLTPIWEQRYSTKRGPPKGEEQRMLLRPVYWLGNWQFACLDYYHPPKGVKNRCVRAEPFPPALERVRQRAETVARRSFDPRDIPKGWKLNTCLVNFYGHRITPDGKRIDTARVGEHRDYEPGPVASLSLGDRALFQFVASRSKGSREGVVMQQWLDDGSLQLFAGRRFKDQLFHRVQRVDRKAGAAFPPAIEGFETRRVNFTFRYVPDEHVVEYRQLPRELREDVREYVERLAKGSGHFARALVQAGVGRG